MHIYCVPVDTTSIMIITQKKNKKMITQQKWMSGFLRAKHLVRPED